MRGLWNQAQQYGLRLNIFSFFPSLWPVRSILTLVLTEAEGFNLSTYFEIIFTAKTFSGVSKGIFFGAPL